MFSVLLTALIIVAVMMIGVILLQKSEGSGMSGSSASSMFAGVLTGASAGNFLTKLTAILAALFFVLCTALALVVSNSGNTRPVSEIRAEIAAAGMAEEIKVEAPVAVKADDEESAISAESVDIPED